MMVPLCPSLAGATTSGSLIWRSRLSGRHVENRGNHGNGLNLFATGALKSLVQQHKMPSAHLLAATVSHQLVPRYLRILQSEIREAAGYVQVRLGLFQPWRTMDISGPPGPLLAQAATKPGSCDFAWSPSFCFTQNLTFRLAHA